MWNLAQDILKTVVKMKTGVAEVIIKQLSKRIMYSKAAPRYTDSLKYVITQAQGELLNKTSVLHELLDQVRYILGNFTTYERIIQNEFFSPHADPFTVTAPLIAADNNQ